jgi:hypothetical protein
MPVNPITQVVECSVVLSVISVTLSATIASMASTVDDKSIR